MENPVNKLLQLLVIFYRWGISPLKGGPCCRFIPTCSEYALTALRKRGILSGLVLTTWRILRCNPFYHGPMYDPVPDTGWSIHQPSGDAACECGAGHAENSEKETDEKI